MMSRLPGILGAVCALLLLASSSAHANDADALVETEVDRVQVGGEVDPSPEAMPPDESESTPDAAANTETGDELAAPNTEPSDDLAAPVPAELAGEPARENSKPTPAVMLGAVGYDDQGREGRIHIVVDGDTLWDISDAYLGTPWVWPSIWTDNRDIQNPHLIMPQDRIWISRYEMRRVTAEEAEQLLSGAPAATGMPAALEVASGGDELRKTYTVSSSESSGFVTPQELESSASVIDSVAPRVMMVQPDEVYIGLGDAEVSAGDQFTVFRTDAKIFDPDTNRLIGYHVNVLGWAEVTKPAGETSIAVIRQSNSEIEAGDRVKPREEPMIEVEVTGSPTGVEGRVTFLPAGRGMMATTDFVYLNRGELDGVTVGNQLAVYREGWVASEEARNERVQIPDRPVADLLVVSTRSETSVALITHTETELELGDRFRGASAFAPASMEP
jgi:hypothetical protein